MTDSSPSDTDEQSDELAAADKTPEPHLVAVPEELSFAKLPESAVANGTVTTNSCSVTLVYCKDPRFSPHAPSFCHTGSTCSDPFATARSICHSICGNIDCSGMWDLGKC